MNFMALPGFRKFYKTRCELAGMKPSMIEVSMGHPLGGVSDSYFRPSEEEILEEYLKAIPNLMMSEEQGLKQHISQFQDNTAGEIQSIKQQYRTMSL